MFHNETKTLFLCEITLAFCRKAQLKLQAQFKRCYDIFFQHHALDKLRKCIFKRDPKQINIGLLNIILLSKELLLQLLEQAQISYSDQ